MHSRTWDRASAVFKWSGTLTSCQIWSLAEFQLAGAEVPGAQLEVGQVVFRGKLGIEVAQGYFATWSLWMQVWWSTSGSTVGDRPV